MLGCVLVLMLFVVGGSPSVDGTCDLIEVNHYRPESGNGFDQLIVWDWSPEYYRWHAQQWLIVKNWDRIGGVVSGDGDGVKVRLSSRLFRETWTIHDPERENQKLFPINERRAVW